MKMNKYNEPKGSATRAESASAANMLRRLLWGQTDTGGDISGDIVSNGNGYIMEGKEQPDGSVVTDTSGIFPDASGNLYVQRMVKAHTFSAVKVTIPNPDPDVAEAAEVVAVLRDYLGRLNGIDRQIKEIIGSNVTEQYVIDTVRREMGFGAYNNPIILFSGAIVRSLGAFSFRSSNPDILQTWDISVSGGLLTLTLTPKPGLRIMADSVQVTQASSQATADISQTTIKNNTWGAHWFEARTNNYGDRSRIYIREFHKTSGSNQEWESSSWEQGMGPDEVNILITGYVNQV